ncbi:LOW QUALITY PROTEIN: zinc finger and SCAN domain-containing protein 5B-like [Eptesicus fuscus]|uniref:LOW QUALITY PROTEIN: zinc finger and SCAN domain-containing protein 5B-like n=1 Tax=Eptesicus fuscus TaxID=29078 RepID=UPI002403ECFE|nr:LOW QUALITY PROTEIN: zinc finger and SCAN domain-containing protein 5B-like [Eptesicus fuscus]
MPTDQTCSDGHGNPQCILGWGLPPSGPPAGRLTEGQYRDSERGHVLFRAFLPPEGSDPLRSLHTMNALLHRWLRPDVRTVKQILDQLVLEKFMTCMPLELQVLVKERRVQSCDELEVLLMNKEKPRKWTVVTFHGQEYLRENSDEEAGDTDLGMDLSVKSPSPISKAGAHPENSPEVLGEPGNQPGPSDMVWGQGQRVLLPETILKTSDPEGVRPKVKVEELEKDVMEDGEEAAVLTSPEPPLPSSPGESVRTEGEQNPQEGIGLEHVDAADVPPTHVPETQALTQHLKKRGSWNPSGVPKRKRGNSTTSQEEHQEAAVPLDQGQVTGQHGSNSVGASNTVEPTGPPVGKESRRQIPYECQDCSKRFSYKSQLDLHRRTHTGERPFQCHYCPKRFIQASDRKVHHWIHTPGQKPYRCTVCKERFTHSSTLRGHERVHTQERPYQCDVCPKSFRHRGNLNVHMRIHSGLRPYWCPQCDGAFRQLGTFQRHQRTCQGAPQRHRVPADPEGKEGVPSGAEMAYEHLDSGGAMN